MRVLVGSKGGLGGDYNIFNKRLRVRQRWCGYGPFERRCSSCHDSIYFDFIDPDRPGDKPIFANEVCAVLFKDLGRDLNALGRDYAYEEHVWWGWTLAEIRNMATALVTTVVETLGLGPIIRSELIADVQSVEPADHDDTR